MVVLNLIRDQQTDLFALFHTDPVIQNNTPLFQTDLRTTAYIELTHADKSTHIFQFQPSTGLWLGESPWKDRADGPLIINQLILFALNAEVIDSFEPEKKALRDVYGVGKNSIGVTFKDSNKNKLASFLIGNPSAWKKRIEAKQEVLIPSVYIRRADSEQRKNIYLCTDVTGDIHKLFNHDWQLFRDHRPLALNLPTLKTVSMKRGKTETVITKDTPESDWKISKPLELDTDPKSLASYLTNLSKLTASKLHEPGSITLPNPSQSMLEISVSRFDVPEKITTLTVYPPAEGATSTYATVSDRDVIFELPLIATANTSNYLTQLPESVNALRSRTMVTLKKKQRGDLRSLIIRTPQQPSNEPVVITRTPTQPYQMLLPNDAKQRIDEFVLKDLLEAISLTPVNDFVSDAATDLSVYGLDSPTLIIDLLFNKGKPMQLIFGKKTGTTDTYFATLRGSSIVWEISPEILTKIALHTWEWKPKLVWNLPVIDILSFTTQRSDQAKLEVSYDFAEDSFQAKQGEQDLSAQINPQRAKYFLNENHHLVAEKRLGPNDAIARKALETPIYTASISVQEYNEEGLPSQLATYTITLAKPNKTGSSAFYYAKASNDPDYLILSLETVRKLADNTLFDED